MMADRGHLAMTTHLAADGLGNMPDLAFDRDYLEPVEILVTWMNGPRHP
jgi:hypothetical protein